MGYMNEFPHSRMFDSDLREILEMFERVYGLPKTWDAFKKEMDENWNKIKTFVNQLDISDEVNKKLDDMAENGELTAIIAEYLQFYVTPQMFGAIGDGVSDDTDAVQNALNTGLTVYMPSGIYLINPIKNYVANPGDDNYYGLSIMSNQKIIGNKASLKAIAVQSSRYAILGVYNKENVIIENLEFIGDRNEHTERGGEWGYGLEIVSSHNVTVNNCRAIDCWGDGFIINCTNHMDNSTKPTRINLVNCYANNNRRQGLSIVAGDNILVSGGEYSGTNGTEPMSGIDVEPNDNATRPNTVIIENVNFENNKLYGLMITSCDNLFVNNCKFADNERSNIYYTGSGNVVVSSCYFKNNQIINMGTYKESRFADLTLQNSHITIESSEFVTGSGVAPYYNGLVTIKDNTLVFNSHIFINGPKSGLCKISNNYFVFPNTLSAQDLYLKKVGLYINSGGENTLVEDNIVINNSQLDILTFGCVRNGKINRGYYLSRYTANTSWFNGDLRNYEISNIEIPPNGLVTHDVEVSGVVKGDVVQVTPLSNLNAIISACCIEDGVITITLRNTTSEIIEINTNINIKVFSI